MENEKNMAMPEFTNEEVEKAIKQFLDEKSDAGDERYKISGTGRFSTRY